MKELKLELIRYRGGEDSDYLYFWTERQRDTAVHVSPMFETREQAIKWYEELMAKYEAAVANIEALK